MDKLLTSHHPRPAWTRSLLLIGCIALPTTAATANLQNHEDIRRAAVSYIAAHHPWQDMKHEVTAGNLDSRARLQRCDGALEAFLPANRPIRQRTSVGVRCLGSQPWKVYLPVSVKAWAPVLVATRPLPAGTPLSASDVTTREHDIAALGYGYVGTLETPGGYRSRISIAQGAVITPRMVESAVMIKKGQRVRLTRATGPIQISMAGEAVSNATLGERIRVRNSNSGRIIEGRVAGAETVEITY